MRATAFLLLFSVAVAARASHAQVAAPAGIRVGDRVRMASDAEPLDRVGRVVALQGDSVSVEMVVDSRVRRVSWSAVRSLAVSEGPRSRAQGLAGGARRGFWIGLGLSAVSAGVTAVACAASDCSGWEEAGYVWLPVTFIVTGTGVGGIVGAAVPGERWRWIQLR